MSYVLRTMFPVRRDRTPDETDMPVPKLKKMFYSLMCCTKIIADNHVIAACIRITINKNYRR